MFGIWNQNCDLARWFYPASFILFFHSIVVEIFHFKKYALQFWKSGWCSSCVQLCFSHLRRLVSFHLLNLRAVKLVLNWFWRYPQFWDQKNVLIPEFADKTHISKPEPRNQS